MICYLLIRLCVNIFCRVDELILLIYLHTKQINKISVYKQTSFMLCNFLICMSTCVCFSFQKQNSSYSLLNKESNGIAFAKKVRVMENMESKSVFTIESKRDYMWKKENSLWRSNFLKIYRFKNS